MEDISYVEERYLAERIAEATRQAESLVNGTPETIEEFVARYRMVLSEYYNIPYYSEYFDNRTLDEMVFEHALIKTRMSPQKTPSEVIQMNTSEAADAASSGWEDVKIDDKELERMKKFMTTGEFIKPGENNVKK